MVGRMVAVVPSCSRCLRRGFAHIGRAQRPREAGEEAVKMALLWAWALSMLGGHTLPTYPGLVWLQLRVEGRQEWLSCCPCAAPQNPKPLPSLPSCRLL